MKTTKVSDMEYDADAVEEIRQAVIQLRDVALAQGAMDWSVTLSHVVALLANLRDILK